MAAAAVSESKEWVPTEADKAAWDAQGFLLIKDFWTEEEVERMAKATEEVEAAPEVRGGIWKYYEIGKETGERLLNRIEFFGFKNDTFKELLTGRAARAIQALVGEEMLLFKEKINFKKPGGDGFKAHQDAQAGWESYGHSCHYSGAICIDPTTIENGCLELVAGKHKEGLLGPEFGEMPDDVVADLDFKPYTMTPRDYLIFTSYVPHRSEPNRTDKQRRVLLGTYNKASEGDARDAYHRDKLDNHPPEYEKVEGKTYRGYVI
eukprot:TRINITY_DN122451_c0_g1_i1.p2 TRINITY_DN122451_c0_g1~~TRINITY_DN122451_c0_g1_i1.p2  ORF type:complete len:290 (+),score=69.90 TRINITY_DN122451_c0_g1_i1:84-872(+)